MTIEACTPQKYLSVDQGEGLRFAQQWEIKPGLAKPRYLVTASYSTILPIILGC